MEKITSSVTLGVYNEEENIEGFIKAVLSQTCLPREIIIVDDGSTDRTAEIIKKYAELYPIIKYIYQKNKGPAAARNNAWKNSNSNICIFTDGDCVPRNNWIEEILKPFNDGKIAAVAGRYETINKNKILSRFIGYEIDYRYRNVKREITAHGSYNLAVKRKILEEIGGFDESYLFPSGEDWDLTYKISKKYTMVFNRLAVVGHYHPEKLIPYLKNQERRGFDRLKIYINHPKMIKGDNYTGKIIKYQVLASAVFVPSLFLIYPFFKFSFLIPIFLLLFLLISSTVSFIYIAKKGLSAALYGMPVQLLRNFAWALGLIRGFLKLKL